MLILKNNIVMRTLRQKGHAIQSIGADVWGHLDLVEQMLFTYLVNHGPASRAQLSEYVDKSAGTVISRLNHLIDIGLVKANGTKYDPSRTYAVSLS